MGTCPPDAAETLATSSEMISFMRATASSVGGSSAIV